MNEVTTNKSVENVRLIYILYLVGLVFGITAIIGVVMAYINKDDQQPEWIKSHYEFLIGTFWKGLIIGIAGALLSVIFIGILIILFLYVWVIIRCVKGMKYLSEQQAHPNPSGWMFD